MAKVEREYGLDGKPICETCDHPIRKEEHVDHPPHYTQHPAGIECIDVVEHMNFNLGNSIKYIWRAGLKADAKVQDLEKAKWYLEREIGRLSK